MAPPSALGDGAATPPRSSSTEPDTDTTREALLSGADLDTLRAATHTVLPSVVLGLLGAWPARFAIYGRGRTASADEREVVAAGLGLLGQAALTMGAVGYARDVLCLAILWGTGGPRAADLCCLLGSCFLALGRAGQAIGPLRRAETLGARPDRFLPLLSRAYAESGRAVAAYGCCRRGVRLGLPAGAFAEPLRLARRQLPVGLVELEHLLGREG